MLVLPLLALLVQSAPSDSARRTAYEAYLDFGDLVRGGRVTPGWFPDGTSFWYAEGGPQDRTIVKVTAAGRKEPLLDPAKLRAALTEKLGYEPAGRGIPFDQLAVVGPSRIRFSLEGRASRTSTGTWRPPSGIRGHPTGNGWPCSRSTAEGWLESPPSSGSNPWKRPPR